MPDNESFAERLRNAARRIPGFRPAIVVQIGEPSEQSELTMRVMKKASEWGKDLATPERQAMAKSIMDRIAAGQAKESELAVSEQMAGIDPRNWVEKQYNRPMPQFVRQLGQPMVDAQEKYDSAHRQPTVDLGEIDPVETPEEIRAKAQHALMTKN